ncbi:MAG: hypothetical protein ACO392_00100 [Ilumatobacteraceae bacterium]
MSSTTRRAFLRTSGEVVMGGTAAISLGSLLAACGGAGSGGGLPDDVQIVQRFPQNLVAGRVRVPISLASNGGLLTVDGDIATPDQLSARILRIDGDRDTVILEDIVAPKHDAGLATPYWPFRATITEPGLYRLVLDGGPDDGAAFQVFARGEVPVPGIGDSLPSFDSPTFDDARGVSPLCTRQPEPCPMHHITLREALTIGKPIAFLVGTPAHCATGTCAPALEAIVSTREIVGDSTTFLHAEVYADPDATRTAEAVAAMSMNYEPALFITDTNGIVVERLDAVFDAAEIRSLIS